MAIAPAAGTRTVSFDAAACGRFNSSRLSSAVIGERSQDIERQLVLAVGGAANPANVAVAGRIGLQKLFAACPCIPPVRATRIYSTAAARGPNRPRSAAP